jgi:hypothetical protein
MKHVHINDLELAKGMGKKALAAVHGGVAIAPGGCFPAWPNVPMNADPLALLGSITALLPSVPATPSVPTYPGQMVSQ